jgi:methyltransferase (TIGR00027 family)
MGNSGLIPIKYNMEQIMKILSLLVFIVVQIIFIPLFIIGGILTSINQLLVSKKLGVSGMAISPIAARWVLNFYGIRKDLSAAKLYRSLPNSSEIGLWMISFPSYLRYKINPELEEYGKESIVNVAIVRTLHFDKLIKNSKNKVEQFIVMGAGYDTRCYGDLKNNNLRFFELDQGKTQALKKECLKKAGIDASHVTFIDVDFTTERWYEKLEKAGYDPRKKSLFLWEGVTIYLSENDVRKTIKEIKEHAASGSILIVDFYSKRITAMQGVKATNENFGLGLDFSKNHENVLKTFIESENVNLGDFYFIGHKTKKGAYGVVTEIIL